MVGGGGGLKLSIVIPIQESSHSKFQAGGTSMGTLMALSDCGVIGKGIISQSLAGLHQHAVLTALHYVKPCCHVLCTFAPLCTIIISPGRRDTS